MTMRMGRPMEEDEKALPTMEETAAPQAEAPQKIILRLQLALEEPAVARLPTVPELPVVQELPAAPPARRYSAWWAFLLGPAVGAAIGYVLVPTLDHYRGDQTIRDLQQQERAPHRRSILPAMATQEPRPEIAVATGVTLSSAQRLPDARQ